MPYHFITGLPRSGTTLLAAILRQNPRFGAGIESPVGQVFTDALSGMGSRNEAAQYLNDDQREQMLRGIVDGYYYFDHHEVIFDNNRRWTANIGAVSRLFPDAIFLAMVRDPRAIVDSFENLFQKNAHEPSVIYGGMANMTAYSRTNELMKQGGVVGFALEAFRTAFHGPSNHKLLVIEYDNLARFPAAVMQDVYNALGEPMFNHDFGNLEPIPGVEEFDARLNTPGLHTVRPAVTYEARKSILPPDILNAIPPPFWRVNEPVTTAG